MTSAKTVKHPKISYEDQSVRVNGKRDWTHAESIKVAEKILFGDSSKKEEKKKSK